MYVLTGTEMKEVDRTAIQEYGIPGMTLMEQAGEAVFKEALKLLPVHGVTVILCGGGNNGGDGYIAARRLMECGLEVKVFSFVEENSLKGDGREAFSRFAAAGGIPRLFGGKNGKPGQAVLDELETDLLRAHLVIDALLGTGIDRPISGNMELAINMINSCKAAVISVDIPSGVGGNDGKIYGKAVKADITVTFQALKVGCVVYPGREQAGEVMTVDIGIPPEIIEKKYGNTRLITQSFVNTFIKRRRRDIHKGTCGKVLVIAGSKGMAGAAVLCGRAALRAGAGLVRISAPEELFPILQTAVPEATCLSRALPPEIIADSQAVIIGPGLGDDDEHVELIEKVLAVYSGPVVLDADGLNILARNKKLLEKSTAGLLVTPHPGEAARIAGCNSREINDDRIGWAREISQRLSAVTVLKGAATVVAAFGKRTYINRTGNPGMASGGSGDVLSGIIGAFAAQGLSPEAAACCGVYIHGLAGDLAAEKLGEYGLIASDIAMMTARAIREILLQNV